MDEGTSDYELVMEWYLLHGERVNIIKSIHAQGGDELVVYQKGYLEDTTPDRDYPFSLKLNARALKLIKEHQNEN